MKNLIMTGLFAFGSIFAFAGNGEKEITELNFEKENLIQVDALNDTEPLKMYEIAIRFNISDGGMTGTSYFQTAVPQTPCMNEAEIEQAKQGALTLYQIMYPDSDLSVVAWVISECD